MTGEALAVARSDNDPLADIGHEILVKLGELCA